MKYWRGFLVAAIVAAITLGLQLLAKQYHQIVDMFYPYLTREIQVFLAQWTGTVDFTVWQVLAMLVLVILLVTVLLMIMLKWNFMQWLGWVLSIASLVWLLHTGIWGLNYFAGPLSDDMRLDSYDFTVDDMEDASIYFLTQANALATQLPRDESGAMIMPTFQAVAEMAGNGYESLTYSTSSVFGGCTLPVKQLQWEKLYTSLGVTGVTFPLTGEAAVNPQTPSAALAYQMCKEMAHRMSIATEADAQFAAFLACRENSEVLYRYSGYFMAYRYCYEALLADGSAEAAAAAARISLQANAQLRHDLQEYDNFFAGSTLSAMAQEVTYTFLNLSGNQTSGTSYSQVSILLFNWYIEEMVMPYVEQEDVNGFDPMDKDYIGGILEGIG